MDLGHLQLKQAAKEILARAADGDLGIVVLVVDIRHHGTHCLTLAEEVAGDRLAFGKQKLVFVVVEQQSLARPCLINLSGDQFALKLLEFVVDSLFLQIEYLRLERLAKGEYGAAAEVGEEYLAGVLVAYLGVGILIGLCVGQSDLQVGIGHSAVLHHFEILEDLHVALVGVEDHIEIDIGAEHFCQHIAERFLKHVDHRDLVDILELLEFGETCHQIGSFLFFCHNRFISCVVLFYCK